MIMLYKLFQSHLKFLSNPSHNFTTLQILNKVSRAINTFSSFPVFSVFFQFSKRFLLHIVIQKDKIYGGKIILKM